MGALPYFETLERFLQFIAGDQPLESTRDDELIESYLSDSSGEDIVVDTTEMRDDSFAFTVFTNTDALSWTQVDFPIGLDEMLTAVHAKVQEWEELY